MIPITRTTKCALITSEMGWRETLVEFRKLGTDRRAIMSLSPEEGARIVGALFAENDEKLTSNFPPNLAEREFKSRLYLGRYGEELPADFFKDKE